MSGPIPFWGRFKLTFQVFAGGLQIPEPLEQLGLDSFSFASNFDAGLAERLAEGLEQLHRVRIEFVEGISVIIIIAI